MHFSFYTTATQRIGLLGLVCALVCVCAGNVAKANTCLDDSIRKYTVVQYSDYLKTVRRTASGVVWPDRSCLDFESSRAECLDISEPFHGGIDFLGNACIRHVSESDEPSRFELDFVGRLDRLILRAGTYQNIKVRAHKNGDRLSGLLYVASADSGCVKLRENLNAWVPFETIELRVCGGSEISLEPAGWLALHIDRQDRQTSLDLDFKHAIAPTRKDRLTKKIFVDVGSLNVWGGEDLSHVHNLGNNGFYNASEPQGHDKLVGHADRMWVKGFPNGVNIAFGAFRIDDLTIKDSRLVYVYSQSGAKSLHLENVSASRYARGMASVDTAKVFLRDVSYPDDGTLSNDVGHCPLAGFSDDWSISFDQVSLPPLNKWPTNKADELQFGSCVGASRTISVKLATVLVWLLNYAETSGEEFSSRFLNRLSCAVAHAKKPRSKRSEFWEDCDPFWELQ